MSSKRLFSWQKRHSHAEPYYKTGGLLPIDSLGNEPSNDHEAKDTQRSRSRPSDISIPVISPDHEQSALSPLSSPYNAHRVSSTSTLMAVFNDMLRSPSSSVGAWSRSASVHKPLPTRPRSASDPSAPGFPAELPGSLLQHNQGFPHLDPPNIPPSRPTSQIIRRGTHPPDKCLEDEGEVFDLLHLYPEPLNHSKSVPSLHAGYRDGSMKSSRAGPAANASANNSNPRRVHHREALSSIEWHSVADPTPVNDNNAIASFYPVMQDTGHTESDRLRMDADKLQQPYPMVFEPGVSDNSLARRASRRDDPGASLTPTLTGLRHKPTEDLHAAIASQNQTIITLQSQFGSLRLSHETHVLSLAGAHAAEVASLRNYARLLEEQLAQHPGLHHVERSCVVLI
ncbi:uncharacterized protein M421DRAFT_308423 [Didymella exigua CBS 183.55]|uniref:Uncharacterized protein n=1 Tax=Didymella exigua CBS 183.55 TaxID=1150837 RepID=A0A6A5R613_9PLEO|nr:uncharacterized protein M421DRAFT_308423 [Didymella exigua CBS 183.55]KAF1923555.1 hypothetical protein M421DRAFT_308423 [Didymella exigua CBS 183.55]